MVPPYRKSSFSFQTKVNSHLDTVSIYLQFGEDGNVETSGEKLGIDVSKRT